MASDSRLLYDRPLGELAQRVAPYKVLSVTLGDGAASAFFDEVGAVASRQDQRVVLRAPRDAVAQRTARTVGDFGLDGQPTESSQP